MGKFNNFFTACCLIFSIFIGCSCAVYLLLLICERFIINQIQLFAPFIKSNSLGKPVFHYENTFRILCLGSVPSISMCSVEWGRAGTSVRKKTMHMLQKEAGRWEDMALLPDVGDSTRFGTDFKRTELQHPNHPFASQSTQMFSF